MTWAWDCEILESVFVFMEQSVSFLRGHGKLEADSASWQDAPSSGQDWEA